MEATLLGIFILLACQLVGTLIVSFLSVPVPGAIAGMALMLMSLCLIGEVQKELGRVSDVLISALPLFLIPAGVGIIVQFKHISHELAIICAALFVSTFVSMLMTGAVLSLMLRGRTDEPNPQSIE